MRFYRNTGAFLALSVVVTATAMAEPTRWSVTNGWDVAFYPSTRGCLAFSSFDGTAFFIGFDTHGNVPALDITVLDDRWDKVVPGQIHTVTVTFGDEPPWTLDMLGVHMDGATGLNILIDTQIDKSAIFVEEFQREMRMTWAMGDFVLGRFTLRGSRRAFTEVLECQNNHATSAGIPATAAAGLITD